MSLPTKPLFYKDYAVEVLELKGDYETWVRDIAEYFTVSGFPGYFKAINSYEMPVWNTDCGPIPADKVAECKQRHEVILAQARYAVYRSIGPMDCCPKLFLLTR